MININFFDIYIKMDNKEGLTLVKTTDEEYNVDYEGRRQGKCIKFTESGKIHEICNYVDDELDGKFICYYYNKNIIHIKCNYSKGLKEGEFISYYYYGLRKKYFEGNYVNNKKEGYWYEYKNEENSVPEIKYYKDGVECDPPSIQVKNARKKV